MGWSGRLIIPSGDPDLREHGSSGESHSTPPEIIQAHHHGLTALPGDHHPGTARGPREASGYRSLQVLGHPEPAAECSISFDGKTRYSQSRLQIAPVGLAITWRAGGAPAR